MDLPLKIIEEEFDILNDEYKKLKKNNAKNEEYKNNARRMLILSYSLIQSIFMSKEISPKDKDSALRMLNKIQEVK